MNEWAIKPKQICVAYYSTDSSTPEEWHRAEILKILNEKSVTVFLVDFGTVTTLKTSHLRFLHRTFQFFPVQGLLAKLANVSPVQPNSKWPASASARLLELLRRPHINAEIVDVDCSVRIYSHLRIVNSTFVIHSRASIERFISFRRNPR